MTSDALEGLRRLGRQLKAARRKRDISVKELAPHLGIPVWLMYRLERFGATGMWTHGNRGPQGAKVLAAIDRAKKWVDAQ